MKWITDTTTLDFNELGFKTRIIDFNQIPEVRFNKQYAINRDGAYTFEDGFNDRFITVLFTQKSSPSLTKRRVDLREVTKELIKEGKLIFDFESSIYYKGRVLNSSNINFGTYDEFQITFVLEPVAYSTIGDTSLTWETADVSWIELNIPWNYAGGEAVTGTQTIVNLGNYKAYPKITVSAGTVTVTKGSESFTIVATEETVVDCRNLIVYDSNGSKMTDFTGDFFYLDPGDNVVTIAGGTAIFEEKDGYI